VRRLLAGQHPELADLPIEPVCSSGTDNSLFRLGEELVVRLPRSVRAAQHAAKEWRWLPRLAPALPLPISVPIVLGEPDGGYPWCWSLSTWIDGEPARVDRLADPAEAAATLCAFTAALQRADPTGGPLAGEQNFHRGVPLSARDAAARAAIAELEGEVDAAAAFAAWKASLSEPPWVRPPVWVHGDLHPGNLLVYNGRLSGVIDFGGLGVGDPACDWLFAWTLLTPEARQVARAVSAVDEATWLRGRGWALYFGLVALPAYQHTNPALAATARRAIDQVLLDYRSSGAGTTPGSPL
jgi:aminoglycoside phosphotransferase (APT) family kinase protein